MTIINERDAADPTGICPSCGIESFGAECAECEAEVERAEEARERYENMLEAEYWG